MRLSTMIAVAAAALLQLSGCNIEPDLHLAVETDNRLHVELVTDTSLRTPYTIYPPPTYYEFRHFVADDDTTEQNVESNTVYSAAFDRYISPGRHRLLAWSDIDSPDGTQVVTVSEHGGRATASTTIDPDGISMRDTTAGDSMGMPTIRHAPEMFYGGQVCDLMVAKVGKRYDANADTMSVTNVKVRLIPLVYCLRMEIILQGNDGHITGTPGPTVLTSMARYVDIASGRTKHEPCGVFFTSAMRRRTATRADSVVTNDTIRGSLTTFGLCDMNPYAETNDNIFGTSRSDLQNFLFFTLTFNNGVSKTFRTDVTNILRHGSPDGLIRLIIKASDIKTPEKHDGGSGGKGGAGFNPTIDDYDDVVHEFDM